MNTIIILIAVTLFRLFTNINILNFRPITDKSLSAPITDELEEYNDIEKDEEIFMKKKQSSMTTEHDWSQYSPAMLKAPMSAALCQPLQPFSKPLPYESSLSPNTSTPVELQSPVAASPKVQQKSTSDSKKTRSPEDPKSQRRPVLTSSASQTLLETKIASLNTVSVNASKEHELEMEILLLKKKQEELKLNQEEEKLKQEVMKTELLKIQIEKETGVKWLFVNDQNE